MKISVIIPTYKRPHLLVKCLTALNDQSFLRSEYEVIVVTDGPDETTHAEVFSFNKKYELDNVICASLICKKGPAAARNKGASLAKGELLVFTDDDCIPNMGWLHGFWNAYIMQSNVRAAFSGQTIVPYSNKPTDYEKNIAHLETAEFITANCACTKNTFEYVKGFDESFPVAWREDSDLHFKLINAGVPILKVLEAIVFHPVRKAGWGISLREQKKSIYNALLYKKHPFLYKKKISRKPLWNYYAIVILFFLFILNLVLPHGTLAIFCISCCAVLVIQFAVRRLHGTSKKASHILEMVVTSFVIPFLSVFWTLYGSVRYKTFLL